MNTEYPILSVIIPAFQAEDTIGRAMNSVLDYPETDLELIVVDDGSSDNTCAVAKSKAKDDSRIRVISQPNSGRSMARNAGLEIAKGEWIAFLDADDKYYPTGLATMVAKTKESSDGVWGGFSEPSGVQTFSAATDVLPSSVAISRILHPYSRTIETRNEDGALYRSVWGKLYSREVIEHARIRFAKGLRFGEDVLFNLRYLFLTDNISILHNPVYYYDTSNSETAGKFSRDDGNYLVAFARAAEQTCRDISNADPFELIGNEAMSVLGKASHSKNSSREIENYLKVAFADPTVLKGIMIARPGCSLSSLAHRAKSRLIVNGCISSAIMFDRAILALKKL